MSYSAKSDDSKSGRSSTLTFVNSHNNIYISQYSNETSFLLTSYIDDRMYTLHTRCADANWEGAQCKRVETQATLGKLLCEKTRVILETNCALYMYPGVGRRFHFYLDECYTHPQIRTSHITYIHALESQPTVTERIAPKNISEFVFRG